MTSSISKICIDRSIMKKKKKKQKRSFNFESPSSSLLVLLQKRHEIDINNYVCQQDTSTRDPLTKQRPEDDNAPRKKRRL